MVFLRDFWFNSVNYLENFNLTNLLETLPSLSINEFEEMKVNVFVDEFFTHSYTINC